MLQLDIEKLYSITLMPTSRRLILPESSLEGFESHGSGCVGFITTGKCLQSDFAESLLTSDRLFVLSESDHLLG
jgi:hypothetical protein